MKHIKSLLEKVVKTIHRSPDRVKYTMNGFVISVGGYVKELSKYAQDTARKIGEVKVNMGNTACNVPPAFEYIEKMKARGVKKRKTTRC